MLHTTLVALQGTLHSTRVLVNIRALPLLGTLTEQLQLTSSDVGVSLVRSFVRET